ncbi:hypothetical protein TESG_08616 [Trichophyton tonsurans CBS 112818]|uniref:Uncharacterized protein n=1 Tax=Trichophyton tonsurans (strain CBS 112818) TaxID=647933 RepID=F2S8H1_TRIT1|nr:hypothetical protein TESG_08616 [Trichophyton tonsurans CBS 112818]
MNMSLSAGAQFDERSSNVSNWLVEIRLQRPRLLEDFNAMRSSDIFVRRESDGSWYRSPRHTHMQYPDRNTIAAGQT